MRGLGSLALVSLMIVTGCGSPPEVPYPQQVTADRAAKDQAFASGSDSPILANARARYLPLTYFPVDESYRVPAQLMPFEGEPAIEMPTSTGKRRAMRRAGRLQFSIKGQPLTLTAFVEANDRDMARLFLPFSDQTNGTETYAAGRYLDLDRTGTGLYDLDFNRAYHPYCYYNPEYDCPYPPRENRLAVPIRSGERIGPARATSRCRALMTARSTMLHAIVFDFDGVLANSEPLHFVAFSRVLAKHAITLEEREYYEKYLGYDDAGAFRAVLSDRGRPVDEATVTGLVGEKLAVFPEVLDGQQVIFPGAAECVRRLAGRMPVAIASGALSHDIDLILSGSGLRESFLVIVGAEQTAHSKPHPDPYLLAVRLLQERGAIPQGERVARGCVAIEDSRWGIRSAKAAGLACVAVTTSYAAHELGEADLIVRNLDEVSVEGLERLVAAR